MEERRDNERGRGASRMSRRIRWGIRVLVALGLAALCLGSVLFVEQRLGKTHTIPDEVFDPRQSENPVMDAATIDGVGGEVQTSGNSGEPADLKWRDTDFAVDPARTEWNYESNGRKVVYLTIDDGPSENTIEVLDILDRYGCKATFFVTGNDPDHYYLIKEAYDRGHTIGLHTFTHDYATVYASADAYFADLAIIGEIVQEQIGYVPCFIRFPGGSSNEVSANYCAGIMTELSTAVQSRGFQYYDWNASTGDGAEHTANDIVMFGTEADGMENIMLLCHDSATKQTTVQALPRIIEFYQAHGYTFEAIDRSTCVVQHGVNN